MAGQRRNADIGLLYDPQRSGERVFCTRWKEILEEMAPGLRVRRNYPYRGATDGLATWLRRRFSERRYLGVELEINQLLLSGSRRSSIQHLVAQSLDALLRS